MAQMTHEEKVAWFKKTADDLRVRAEFAQSRAFVIEPQLAVQSTVRQIFKVETVEAGNSIHYDIPFDDVDCVFLMPQIGGIPTVQLETREMTVDTFGMDGGVEYQEDIARDGRVPIADRAAQMLRNKFIALEELCGWALIKTHAAALTSSQKLQAFTDAGAQTPGSGKFNTYTLNEALTMADEFGIGGRRITDVYLSPRRFNDFRNAISLGTALPDSIKERFYNDGSGPAAFNGIRFHKVYNTSLVSNSKAYAFTQRDGYTYGVMPIRQKLVTRDNPIAMLERKIGTLAYQRVGFGVLDSKGLIEITF